MMQQIEFMYDFGSPNAYLVHKCLPDIAKRCDAEVVFRPILIGGVFKATNNQPPLMAFADIPGKVDYMRVEMARFLERHQIAFKFNPHFPVNTLNVMRASVYASGKEWENKYISTVFDAMWVDGKDMSNLEVVAQTLTDGGLPTDEIMNAMQDPSVKSSLADVTAAAVARKIYGSPTMFVGQEMFFGKDSLSDLEWRLSQP
jgi:2-hydroxychromene-2-carboxylate isomerase